ncbi:MULTISPECIES: DUF3093 family protein [unclassified Brachybacterium]|uniref:DUF3093 family protein n=1 Tax=unclassified Brachybacterium TaxID=2623841 RepID=UPI000C80767C|nr:MULTISPECIES: DUF3093 family protein [unclassified Brachybacterium]PMC75786.1 DUF3093 domain-containing protein [Brachybacterium sp. UMB0905]
MSATTSNSPDPAARSQRSSRAAGHAPTGPTGGTLFHEHLLPGLGGWVIAFGLGGSLGLALVPMSPELGGIVAVVAILAAIALVMLYSPVLDVTGSTFRLGRAHIDVAELGEVQVLTGQEWQRTIGQDFEPLAHHCIRSWARSGIRVPVLDREDPVTAWVASTRRPEDLAAALQAAQRMHSSPPDRS